MPSLVIKNLPQELHRKLKEQASRHHRSMIREAVTLLEQALSGGPEVRKEPPVPFRGRLALTDEFLDRAKREGRA